MSAAEVTTGPPNQHFIRDIGLAYLGSGLILLYATANPIRRWRAAVVGGLWLTLLLCRELRLRHHAERELAQQAAIDALTGVANRRTLDAVLSREWSRAQRTGTPLSMLMIDADHFKAFNDRHGHQGGDDEFLEAVEKLVHDCFLPKKRPSGPCGLTGAVGC